MARSLFSRDGDASPFLYGWHNGFAGRRPISGEGEAAVGEISDTHINADDVLGLLFFGRAIFRERQSALLELLMQPCSQDGFGATGTDSRRVCNEF